MAVLEKIRSRSVLLFTIIIVALLAFILGDFFNSGKSFFGPGDTVAKANGAKVSLQEYRTLYDQYSSQAKDQGVNNDLLEEQVIQTLLAQSLLDKECERLGISVTDATLSQVMLSPQTSNFVMGVFASKTGFDPQAFMQVGLVNTTAILDAVNNPAKYKLDAEMAARFKSAWAETETDIERQLKTQSYAQLLGGLFTASEIDAKALYNERNTTFSYSYVTKDYITVPDDKVKLNDEDYKAVYDQQMGRFRLNEDARYIHAIVVPIVPSAADIEAVNTEIRTLVAELSADTTGNPAAIVRAHKNFEYNSAKATKRDLLQVQDEAIRQLAYTIDSLAVGEVAQLPTLGNNYYTYKLISKSKGLDSITYTAYPVEKPDSLQATMARLTTANIDSLTRLVSPNLVDYTQSIATAPDEDKFARFLETAPLNTLVAFNDTINGAPTCAIVDVKKRASLVDVFELGIAAYRLMPSVETEKTLAQNLRNYVGKNGNAEAFVKNAGKASYAATPLLVSASNPLGDFAPNSMTVLKWAMNADKGAVSKVYTLNYPSGGNYGGGSYLLAVCVDDIFDEDYIPVTSAYVKENLKPIVLRNKKAQYVMDQFKGKKTLAEAAKAFGTDVKTTTGSFGMNNNSPELLAAIAAAKPNTLVGPVKGASSVYYIQVNGNPQTAGRPYDYTENSQYFLQNNLAMQRATLSQLYRNPMVNSTTIVSIPNINLLMGDSRLTNNILEFTNGDEQ